MKNFMPIDIALSAWSVSIQLMIQLPLFIVFLVSWFATRRKPFLRWATAWGINLIALTQVLIVSYVFPHRKSPEQILFYALYGVNKILFTLILFVSAIEFSGKDRRFHFSLFSFFPALILLWVVFLFLHPVYIQIFVYGTVAFLLLAGGVVCFKERKRVDLKVVSFGFFIHGLMFLHHFIVMFSWFFNKKIPVYMTRASFFDAISEFILALTFFVGLVIRLMGELKEANLQLERNQESLRALVDVDPLTGLKNRRVLRSFFKSIERKNGCMAFVDVNDFKDINDNLGHSVGDKCLVEIASKLKSIFRSDDGLFRIGGDEFLIVCPGLSRDEIEKRIEKFKKEIRNSIKDVKLTVACGIESFDENSRMDFVLQLADRKMYEDKKRDKS